MPPKKGSQRSKTKKQSDSNPRATPTESIANVLRDNEALRRELAEASEQQTALREILRMIASSPADLQSVMDAIAENAARLCDADDVVVRRVDGDALEFVSHFGSIPAVGGPGRRLVFDRGSVPGRAVMDQQTFTLPLSAEAG